MPDDNPFRVRKTRPKSESFHANLKTREQRYKLAQARRMLLVDLGVWLTAKGEEIKIRTLSDQHLGRIIARLNRHNSPFKVNAERARMEPRLREELARRSLELARRTAQENIAIDQQAAEVRKRVEHILANRNSISSKRS